MRWVPQWFKWLLGEEDVPKLEMPPLNCAACHKAVKYIEGDRIIHADDSAICEPTGVYRA